VAVSLDQPEQNLVGVVIPLHQEERIAKALSLAIREHLTHFPESFFVLVCDSCTDSTESILESEFSGNDRVLITQSELSKGYGNAITHGFACVAKLGIEWCVVTDSDLSNPLRQIEVFYQVISQNESYSHVSLVKGNRFSSAKPSLFGLPLRRLLMTCSGNFLSRVLLLNRFSKDPTNGFRAMKVDLRIRLDMTESGFSSITEELYKTVVAGGEVADAPASLHYDESLRKESSFTFNVETYFSYLKWILKLSRIRRK
jgi:hypothetical protein